MSHMKNPSGKTTGKPIRPVWRWVIAFVALTVLVIGIINYQVASSINWSYFKSRAVPMTPVDFALGVFVLYLLFVAISGRWLPVRRVSVSSRWLPKPLRPNNSFEPNPLCGSD